MLIKYNWQQKYFITVCFHLMLMRHVLRGRKPNTQQLATKKKLRILENLTA